MGKKPVTSSSVSKKKPTVRKTRKHPGKKNKKTQKPSQNIPTSRAVVDLFEGDVPNVDALCYLITRIPGPLKELSVHDVEKILGKIEGQEKKKTDGFVKPVALLPSCYYQLNYYRPILTHQSLAYYNGWDYTKDESTTGAENKILFQVFSSLPDNYSMPISTSLHKIQSIAYF